MSVIHARFRTRQGTFLLDTEFRAPARGVVGLFGPSGAGKSTLLRCLAGLARAEVGFLSVGDEVWQDDARGIFVRPHERGVGYVFQEPSLFPHLSVHRNILYGYRRVPRKQRTIEPAQAIAWTGIAPLLTRMPGGLSGGERQRVAIARALLSNPKLLLLDEPLTSLDDASRAEILPCLERLHRDLSIPVIFVSHSIREVARIADTLALMYKGGIREYGPLNDVLPHLYASDSTIAEEDPFTVIDATVLSHDDAYALSKLQTPFAPLWSSRIERPPDAVVRIQIAARDVSVGMGIDERSSILNQFPVRIAAITDQPPGNRLLHLVPGTTESPVLFALVTHRSCDHLGLHVGQSVYARVKGVSILK